MVKGIFLIVFVMLMFIAGCTSEQEAKVRELLDQHRCASFNGYLCSAPDDCGLPYLDTIESYCCPIKCQRCNQSCDDGNQCTRDYCSKTTDYICKYDEIKPCPNNGICEEGEYRGDSPHCPGETYTTSTSGFISSNTDCPSTCDDNELNTKDWYDFEAQECNHKECEAIAIPEITTREE